MSLQKSAVLIIFVVIINLQVYCLENTETVFTKIYNECWWGKNENNEGSSGDGSTVAEAGPYMDFLQKFIEEKSIKSIVDIGCGDWNFSKHIDWGERSYLGVDVVKFIIEKNQENFTSENIHFIHADILDTPLPSADLLLCKDVMQHLPNDDIKLFMEQVAKYKYCLITNDVNPKTFSSNNRQIPIGHCRALDLTKPPFDIKACKIFKYESGRTVKQVLLIDNTYEPQDSL